MASRGPVSPGSFQMFPDGTEPLQLARGGSLKEKVSPVAMSKEKEKKTSAESPSFDVSCMDQRMLFPWQQTREKCSREQDAQVEERERKFF